LDAGGAGIKAYAEAVGVYLALGVSRMTDIDNSICRWEISKTQVRNLFTRQAIPMMWDYAENNVFNNAAGDFATSLGNLIRAIERVPAKMIGIVKQQNAMQMINTDSIVISTDPPYYDNIGYADLSDFFYIWLRRSLQNVYPTLFSTMLVPKVEELVATPYRFDGNQNKAKTFFENGMLKTFKRMRETVSEKYPLTVYYAYK
jgi:putative DNA methylase